MQTLLVWLKKLDHAVSVTTRTICIVALAAIFVMFLLNVFVRFVPVYNFTQTDDWIQLCLVWMIFLGAQELGAHPQSLCGGRFNGTDGGHADRAFCEDSRLSH